MMYCSVCVEMGSHFDELFDEKNERILEGYFRDLHRWEGSSASSGSSGSGEMKRVGDDVEEDDGDTDSVEDEEGGVGDHASQERDKEKRRPSKPSPRARRSSR
jgi:hypothetical protein